MRAHVVHQSFADYVKGLTGGLQQCVPLEVTAIVSGDQDQALTSAASTVIRCPRFRNPMSLLRSLQAVRQVCARPCDVLHWQAAGNPWVDAAMVRFVSRQPFVLTIHDMVAHPGDQAVLPGTFAAIGSLARRADHTIVHAESVKQQVMARGVASNTITVLPHGELASVYQDKTLAQPAYASDKLKVLFFGRVCEYKGLDRLLAAMEQVVTKVADAQLVVAGDGPALAPAIERYSRAPWLEVRRGFVERAEVPQLFSDSAVVALPYMEASQSGVAALATGFGRAIVASAVGGLQELVVDGTSGLLVPPGDHQQLVNALAEVLGDQSLRSRLEFGARSIAASTLSWEVIAEQTTEIYRTAVDSWRSAKGPSG